MARPGVGVAGGAARAGEQRRAGNGRPWQPFFVHPPRDILTALRPVRRLRIRRAAAASGRQLDRDAGESPGAQPEEEETWGPPLHAAMIARRGGAPGLGSAGALARRVPAQPRPAPAAAGLRARARGARQRLRERRGPPVPAHLSPQRARDPVRARRQRGRGPVGRCARERLPRRDALRPHRPEARAARLARRDDGRVRAHADDPDGVGGIRDLHALGHRQRRLLAFPVRPPRRADPSQTATRPPTRCSDSR